MADEKLFEREIALAEDPLAQKLRGRSLYTQPYDNSIASLISQIDNKEIFLRPLGDRPNFQRRYVWSNKLASKLIESLLLNVPIPPIYMSENQDDEFDIIDGQQRVFSLYRFLKNDFALSGLDVLDELNGKRFHKLSPKLQRSLKHKTLRCVVVTKETHPDIKFEIFERLNTNTSPLNAQEIRNCTARGPLIDLIGELSLYEPWLDILGRKLPDKRLRDEEAILRSIAFFDTSISDYKTPQKNWLNDYAEAGMKFDKDKIESLSLLWRNAIDNVLVLYEPDQAFRRPADDGSRKGVVNRALMDLFVSTLHNKSCEDVVTNRDTLRQEIDDLVSSPAEILNEDTFDDLISRAVDHTSRVKARFAIWNDTLEPLFG